METKILLFFLQRFYLHLGKGETRHISKMKEFSINGRIETLFKQSKGYFWTFCLFVGCCFSEKLFHSDSHDYNWAVFSGNLKFNINSNFTWEIF